MLPTLKELKNWDPDKKIELEALTKNAAILAREAALKTKRMKPKVGKAAHVGNAALKHPDAGAMAIAVLMQAIHNAIRENDHLLRAPTRKIGFDYFKEESVQLGVQDAKD